MGHTQTIIHHLEAHVEITILRNAYEWVKYLIYKKDELCI
jgi:hypothetical protein